MQLVMRAERLPALNKQLLEALILCTCLVRCVEASNQKAQHEDQLPYSVQPACPTRTAARNHCGCKLKHKRQAYTKVKFWQAMFLLHEQC